MKVLVLGGPNLNLLGQREPEIYGSDTLKDIENFVNSSFGEEFVSVWRQSNDESELINWIQDAKSEGFEALVINPAGLTHTSVSLHDALKFFEGTKIEVHLSNTYKREEFRKVKITSGASDGVIEGLGKYGYKLAFQYILDKRK
ncbi:MAG: 3-dehydroquinate dehydratase [Halobacteriovoraceae bacterium]|nr:3-dehydroquinate dehydratase [Halobacteriovoraceae bacterium]|tara:strand:+ start:1082 stop:1513 length:432 start_codon:yes stop_codon:yes gene_type:complete